MNAVTQAKECATIQSTYDYALFSYMQGNRALNERHVEKLMNNFKKAYLVSPILVNDNYQIIDGQHRYEAAKRLGLHINYMIVSNYNLPEIQMLNSLSQRWKFSDYIFSYAKTGKKEYSKLSEFIKMFPQLTTDTCVIIMNIGSWKDIKTGELKTRPMQEAIECAKKIVATKPLYSGYNRRAFIYAILGLFKKEQYSHDLFLHKLSLQPTAMRDCVTVKQYVELIEEIYNYKNHTKVNLRF